MRRPLLLALLAFSLFPACRPDEASPDTGLDTGPETPGYQPRHYDVDGYWGEAPPLEDRLELFEEFWQELADHYAGFGPSGVDWDAVYRSYRGEVEAAESMGRFFWVFGDIGRLLQNGHTYILSQQVCAYDSSSRPPRLVLLDTALTSGACLTPLDDDRLLVTRAEDDNPAGLAPGDLVLGYEGHGWREILAALEPLELPLCAYHASADLAQDYNWMGSVLSNWQLFETLDVQRYGSQEIEHIETSVFEGYSSELVCSDQLPVEGVDLPYDSWGDYRQGAANTSWGILEGTNIGYVYAYAWTADVTEDFGSAIAELMDTDALIIDQRFNMGGGTSAAAEGLALLFDEDVDHIMNCATRASGSAYDDLDVAIWGWHDIEADPGSSYDKPIAVLTGPHAFSAGDLVPYYLSFHPRVRRFGRITNGSFGSITDLWSPDTIIGDLYAYYAYSACVDADLEYLEGAEVHPETEVWLETDDVAAGTDTVVQAALEWIASENAGR